MKPNDFLIQSNDCFEVPLTYLTHDRSYTIRCQNLKTGLRRLEYVDVVDVRTDGGWYEIDYTAPHTPKLRFDDLLEAYNFVAENYSKLLGGVEEYGIWV